ncbi:Rrf2 family transcriptional regulator [bacterium]|nr:Rrf2 family transcriptional regulator [FCB group bacterium]MBL7190749.1 Rrf2 family transcriptional regulator [bacterium]
MNYLKSTEDALHGLIYITASIEDEIILLPQIAIALKCSESYLRKIFQTLTRSGLVIAQRGINGGYKLAKNPVEISVWDVIQATEGFNTSYYCHHEKMECNLHDDCLMRKCFILANEEMKRVLSSVNLKMLAKEMKNANWFKYYLWR